MTAETKADLPPWDGKLPPLEALFLGNHHAIAMMAIISRWTHLYDDLIDADAPWSASTVHQVMWEVMVDLNLNPFFVQHRAALVPIIATGILNWRGANDMEKTGSEEELHISHATRYSINDVALMVMVLVGGPAHAAQYARAARLAFQRDTFQHYVQEHTNV